MNLPGGTVTFLFTDIEGSTRLIRELGEKFPEVQEDHRVLLRSAFRDSGGHELRTEGDSFFCVFASAIDACRAAAAAQRGVMGHEWPNGASVRVRVGLHTGEAPVLGNEYVGLDVHHAARIAGAAHGGQVLLSETTHSLVEYALPAGLAIRELGVHRLKDLARAERLYQLVVEGLPAEFPPLRTLDATPNNLPIQLTSFIGRSEEVHRGRHLLESTRLLTLTGPGGIGKTRLSLQIAADLVEQFPDGVYFVPLSAIRDAELVASVVAQVLGLPLSGSRLPIDGVIEHLRDKQALLVLDNLEQLLPDAAVVVSRLLQTCGDVKVIVTSRTILHLYGEQEFSVQPLGLPDPRVVSNAAALSQYEAVKLFIERALGAKPDFQVTNDNAPAIAGICERVDGLPLAIELAAARSKLFSPQALLSRLNTSLSVLGSGARDLPGRQQTLRGAIAWSYELLDAPGRRLLSRFSVFARGAGLEQAEEVCGPAEEIGVEILDGLEELADQSLLRRLPDFEEPRLLMLQTIREFALEQLQLTGEMELMRDRHAAAFIALAEQASQDIFGDRQKAWLDRLEREHDNFRAALDWCVARGDPERALLLGTYLWRFWQMRGHLHEARTRLEAILAMPGSRDHPAARRQALEAAGGVAYWQADMPAAQRFYDECLELTRDTGDMRAIANAIYNSAFPKVIDRSDIPRAVALLQEALPMFREVGDDLGVGRCLWAIGNCWYFQDRPDPAVEPLDEAINIFRRLGAGFDLGWALHMRALVAIKQLDPVTATVLAQEALRMFSAVRDVSGLVLLVGNFAEIARLEGDLTRAIRLAGASAAHEASTGAGIAGLAIAIDERLRDRISGEEEERAWAEGQAMSIDDAVAYALEGAPVATPPGRPG